MTTRRYLTLMAAAGLVFDLGLALAQGDRPAAVDLTNLYTVEVPLERGASDRRAAYEQALQEVLVRVTGSDAVAQSQEVRDLFPDPGRYVLRFRPGTEQSLFVTLDGPAIEGLLRQAGLPVWGADRPLTLVWLAVDWGQGDREIVAAGDTLAAPQPTSEDDRNAELRERLSVAAQRRGLPILFPLLDTQDLEEVSSSDVWGGFDETLLQASRRYGTSSILVGRVRANAASRGRWSYYSATQRLEWSGAPEDVVAALAETFADEFAYTGNAAIESVTLTVSGVDSVNAYGRVQRLLGGLNVIDSHRLHSVAGADLSFEVKVRGGSERLASALDFSGILRRADWLQVQDYLGNRDRPATLGYLYLADDAVPDDQSETIERQDFRSAGGVN